MTAGTFQYISNKSLSLEPYYFNAAGRDNYARLSGLVGGRANAVDGKGVGRAEGCRRERERERERERDGDRARWLK